MKLTVQFIFFIWNLIAVFSTSMFVTFWVLTTLILRARRCFWWHLKAESITFRSMYLSRGSITDERQLASKKAMPWQSPPQAFFSPFSFQYDYVCHIFSAHNFNFTSSTLLLVAFERWIYPLSIHVCNKGVYHRWEAARKQKGDAMTVTNCMHFSLFALSKFCFYQTFKSQST